MTSASEEGRARPGAKTSEVASVLKSLRGELVPLVQAIMESGRKAPVEILQREYPAAAQEALTRARSALRSHALDGEQVLDV